MSRPKPVILFVLMLIGEGIFLLPFVITRVFRPTFLTVFGINNLELGTAFSVYGIIAAFSYFLGGPLADRFAPKKLLVVSLLATASAGFIMATLPSLATLTILYGFWGMSTILLFWAAYIKGIRQFGGEQNQGKSHGLVDGGRGFVAALIATSSVFLLDFFLPTSADQATAADLSRALSFIILFFTGFVIFCAIIVVFLLPATSRNSVQENLSLNGISNALRHKSVWLQALIVLTAYVGYKCTDDFGLFVKDTYGYDDVASAHMATISFWMRPVAAIIAGFLGDRLGHSKVAIYAFGLLILGGITIASGVLQNVTLPLVIISIASTSLGIYGLRGLYYALFQESKIPLSYTGAAIGFIAVVGYTPDIFMGPLMGLLLDSNPGALGHRYLFSLLAAFGLVGLISTILFRKIAAQDADH
ncbi:MAG: MFS transporter [Bacteroidota bacterium]